MGPESQPLRGAPGLRGARRLPTLCSSAASVWISHRLSGTVSASQNVRGLDWMTWREGPFTMNVLGDLRRAAEGWEWEEALPWRRDSRLVGLS